MKGIILFVLVMLFFALSSAGDEDLTSLYREFRVPTYEVKNLWVSGRDVFRARKIGDYYEVSSYPSAGFYWLKQSPQVTCWLDEDASLHVYKSGSTDYEVERTRLNNRLRAEARVHLTGYQGVFLKGGTSTRYSSEGNDYVYGGVGLGVGRVTEVTPIARVIAASKEVLSASVGELSREAILDVAEMIDKKDAYMSDFEDDWEERFYEDLEEVLESHGASGLSLGQVFRLREALFSYIYRISPKFIGWEFSAGYESSLRYDGTLRGERGTLHAHFEYARPIALNKQFRATVFSSLPFGQMDLRAQGRVSYTIDHTYHWASYARGVVGIDVPEGESAYHYYKIRLGSYYGITNELWAHTGASIAKDHPWTEIIKELGAHTGASIPKDYPWTESVDLRVDLGFTYYIF